MSIRIVTTGHRSQAEAIQSHLLTSPLVDAIARQFGAKRARHEQAQARQKRERADFWERFATARARQHANS